MGSLDAGRIGKRRKLKKVGLCRLECFYTVNPYNRHILYICCLYKKHKI
jgi:hypothetical protein